MPCGVLSSNNDTLIENRSYDQDINPTGSISYSGPDSRIEKVDRLETFGQCTIGYYKLKREGKLLPFTNFSQYMVKGSQTGTHETFKVRPGADVRQGNVPIWIRTGEGLDFWVPSKVYLSSFAPDCSYELQKAAAKVYADGSHDTLTFLAEFSKTRKILMDTLGTIYKYLLRPKRPHLTAPGAWLLGRYAWRPLVSDLESLRDAINRLSDKERSRMKAHAETRYTEKVEESFAVDTYAAYTTDSRVIDINISARGSVIADFTPPVFSFNVARTAWEFVPFSFVIDWVLNIGQWIAASSFMLMNTERCSGAGYKIDGVCTTDWQVTSWKPTYSGTLQMSSDCQFDLTGRYPKAIPHVPLYRFRVDELKYLDLAALIWQAFHRKLPLGSLRL